VTEVRESWREFDQRFRSRAIDCSKSEDRSVAIDFIYEIMDEFIDPTEHLMVPQFHEHPPDGWDYSCEYWLNRRSGFFDWAAEQAYGEAFGASRSPTASAVVSLLAEHGLELRSADAANFHNSWIGGEAAARIVSILSGLQAVAADRGTPQREQEFVRLVPLLDRVLPSGVAGALSSTLFELSRPLAHQEACRRERDFSYIARWLQIDARAHPID
jgi:hypothetical protein